MNRTARIHSTLAATGLTLIAGLALSSTSASAAGAWEWYDLNRDGRYDTAAIDDTGDGNVDRAFTDFNGDGYYEIQYFNNDGDVALDWMYVDADGPGQFWFHDLNNDGVMDHVLLDRDGGGNYEGEVYDSNRDNVFEWQKVDLYWSDGIADTWTQSGSSSNANFVNTILVNHISTMTVLGNLSRAGL